MAAARAGDAVKFYSPLNRLRKSLSSRSQSLAKVVLALQEKAPGEMAEWLKAHAWKACVRETVPWVRIPLSPPARLHNYLIFRQNSSGGRYGPQLSPQIRTFAGSMVVINYKYNFEEGLCRIR